MSDNSTWVLYDPEENMYYVNDEKLELSDDADVRYPRYAMVFGDSPLSGFFSGESGLKWWVEHTLYAHIFTDKDIKRVSRMIAVEVNLATGEVNPKHFIPMKNIIDEFLSERDAKLADIKVL